MGSGAWRSWKARTRHLSEQYLRAGLSVVNRRSHPGFSQVLVRGSLRRAARVRWTRATAPA